MENAAKALLIAAGIFFALMIVSALVIFYNQISAFYAADHEATVIEQTREFNERFENYNRNNIRGNDLISLMNRVIDYNASQSYQVGTNYKRIIVEIYMGADKDTIQKEFKYDYKGTKYGNKGNDYIDVKITNGVMEGEMWQNDKKLIGITNTSVDLCNQLRSLGVLNPTDTQLQQLSSNAHNILLEEDENEALSYQKKRQDLIKDTLGLDLAKMTDSEKADTLKEIKEITNLYYQYTQFKRAVFDCKEIKYDPDTNRVVGMKFELQYENEKPVFN